MCDRSRKQLVDSPHSGLAQFLPDVLISMKRKNKYEKEEHIDVHKLRIAILIKGRLGLLPMKDSPSQSEKTIQ